LNEGCVLEPRHAAQPRALYFVREHTTVPWYCQSRRRGDGDYFPVTTAPYQAASYLYECTNSMVLSTTSLKL